LQEMVVFTLQDIPMRHWMGNPMLVEWIYSSLNIPLMGPGNGQGFLDPPTMILDSVLQWHLTDQSTLLDILRYLHY